MTSHGGRCSHRSDPRHRVCEAMLAKTQTSLYRKTPGEPVHVTSPAEFDPGPRYQGAQFPEARALCDE
eukprot:3113189-Amphidinium_carterae.1